MCEKGEGLKSRVHGGMLEYRLRTIHRDTS